MTTTRRLAAILAVDVAGYSLTGGIPPQRAALGVFTSQVFVALLDRARALGLLPPCLTAGCVGAGKVPRRGVRDSGARKALAVIALAA
jgi:hypothetical protein